MKKYTSFSIILIVLPLTLLRIGFAQQKPMAGVQTKPGNSESDITNIRSVYTQINALPLRREAFKFEASGCVEDGLITYYRSNQNIVKVRESGSIGDGSWTTEFYFDSGKLIFCYDKLIGGAAAEKEVTTEYRLYIKNDRPVRCMENKKVIRPDSEATEIISTAYKLIRAYKTKNFAAALCN